MGTTCGRDIFEFPRSGEGLGLMDGNGRDLLCDSVCGGDCGPLGDCRSGIYFQRAAGDAAVYESAEGGGVVGGG